MVLLMQGFKLFISHCMVNSLGISLPTYADACHCNVCASLPKPLHFLLPVQLHGFAHGPRCWQQPRKPSLLCEGEQILIAISGANLTDLVAGNFSGTSTGIHTISNVGVQTANMTAPDLVGAASSMVGLYIGDGHLLFSNYLNRSGGYYITTGLNALNAGPVTLGSTMTLDGAWVIV